MTVGRSAGVTDTGRKRRRNEDAYVVRPPLFAVADGMGGARAGEVASRLAVEALGGDPHGGEEGLASMIREANRRVYERAGTDSSAAGMGTTITVALVEDDRVTFGHVGDSRAYRIREGHLEQLTEDHSLVQELIRGGKLSPEEAETHPQRSVITRALGTDPEVDVDTFTVEARPGDVFMLCSDGLTSMVDDELILETLERGRGDLEAAADELVRRANRGGGEDNITVVFFEIAEEGANGLEATQPLPALAEEPRHADDEDTLDGLEAPAAVDTMVVAPEDVPEALRPEPEPEPRRRARDRDAAARRVLATVAVVAVAAIMVALLVWGLVR